MEFMDGSAAMEFGTNWGAELYERTISGPEWVGLKTHEYLLDSNPVIWIVRDGRDACAGLARYWDMSVRDVMVGLSPSGLLYGTWATSYHVWYPPGRANRIMVRFDDILERPEMVIEQVANLLSIKPIGKFVNRFKEGHKNNPGLFSGRGKDHSNFEHNDWELFWRINGSVMKELGYVDEIPQLTPLPTDQQEPRGVLIVKSKAISRPKFLSYPVKDILEADT
ncbi:hypothetical protein LCGC14_0297430 [marine sediment metagenome]|uniref:Sulfotransferase domain-containing protein n=1 Tax=marine sediment metagenome TaxID=412755 RepID=A0A0F9TR13_9ZZZZ